jgi:hypothetical protein
MCERGTLVSVTPPPEWNHHRPIIALDSCIADTVVALWQRGVVTLGSCCGHVGNGLPSLVLSDDAHMPALAQKAIGEVDPDRRWELLQWQLVDVAA